LEKENNPSGSRENTTAVEPAIEHGKRKWSTSSDDAYEW
jgi:hypothetical protein